MSNIKVLYIISLLGKKGGAEKNLCDLVQNIDKKEFTPYVLSLKGGELASELKEKGFYSEVLNLNSVLGLDALKKGICLYRLIQKEGIQIVVSYHHDADIWGGIIAKLAGVPVVISNRRDLGYQLQKKHVWAYRILNRSFSAIVCVSDAVKKEVIKREWASTRKMTTIYNGVEANDFKVRSDVTAALRKSLGISPSTTVIGMLGSIRPVKGHEYLVKAIASVINTAKDIKVLLVGYDKTEYFKEVRALISHLGLDKYFIFTGDRTDIPEIISVFDIFVLSSRSEGFSNALLEAMASGKPTIATDNGGNSEVVIDRQTGLLIPPCEVKPLAETLLELLSDERLRRSLGEEGLKAVSRRFTVKRMMDETEGLYKSLLTASSGNSSLSASQRFRPYIRKSVKNALGSLIHYTGFKAAHGKFTASSPRVLAYHSINAVSLKSLEIEQDTRIFEHQISFLKKNFTIISLTEFLKCRCNSNKFPPNAVLLTFDDGYRDNYVNALPILIEHNVPAAIFITTGPIETNEPLFFDALRYTILNTRAFSLDLRDAGLSRYDLPSSNEPILLKAIKEITAYSKNKTPEFNSKFIALICERLGVDREEVKEKCRYLSWKEIHEMVGHGIEFGSHTQTHPKLSHLSFEECKAELTGAKKIIEARIKLPVKTLAYPFGGRADYNEKVEKAAIESGYECAFSLCPDKYDTRKRLFTIGRKMVDSHMTSTFSGEFSESLFLYDMLRS